MCKFSSSLDYVIWQSSHYLWGLREHGTVTHVFDFFYSVNAIYFHQSRLLDVTMCRIETRNKIMTHVATFPIIWQLWERNMCAYLCVCESNSIPHVCLYCRTNKNKPTNHWLKACHTNMSAYIWSSDLCKQLWAVISNHSTQALKMERLFTGSCWSVS